MNRGIYSTATGMIASQKLLDMVTNNLANASTNGFKADGVTFADAMERQMNIGPAMIGTLGSGSTIQGQYTDFAQGSIVSTRNPLDLAIGSQKGLFAVQLPNNTTAYTRDGSFTLDANRQLVTMQGYPVLDTNRRPIQVEPGTVQIEENGLVSANGKAAGTIGVFDGSFTKLGGNLFGSSTTSAIQVPLISGSIESSNVNPIESMIQMITLNRSFELAQKSMIQQDDLSQKLIQSIQQ